MENLNTVVTILGNGFFPIVMCGVLLYGGYKLFSKFAESHKAESEKFAEVVDNNTKVVEGVVTRLEKVETKLDDIEDKVDDIITKGEKT